MKTSQLTPSLWDSPIFRETLAPYWGTREKAIAAAQPTIVLSENPSPNEYRALLHYWLGKRDTDPRATEFIVGLMFHYGIHIARTRFYHPSLDEAEDVFNMAVSAIMKAVQEYDVVKHRDVSFETFCKYNILDTIRVGIGQFGAVWHPPTFRRLYRKTRSWMKEHKIEASQMTVAAVNTAIGMTRSRAAHTILEMIQCADMAGYSTEKGDHDGLTIYGGTLSSRTGQRVSMERPSGPLVTEPPTFENYGRTPGVENVQDVQRGKKIRALHLFPDGIMDSVESFEALFEKAGLSPEEVQVTSLFFGFGSDENSYGESRTFLQIEQMTGINSRVASQHHAKALKKIKKTLGLTAEA